MLPDPALHLADISVMLLAPNGIESLHITMKHLAAQTIRDRIELVVAIPSRHQLGLKPEDCALFAGVQVAEFPEVTTFEDMLSKAILAATSPLVVLAEEHCWPEPQWAEALVHAHQQPDGYTVVGCSMVNANPDNAVSWTGLLYSFGPYIAPVESHLTARLPTHNSCYRRDVLLAQGDNLPAILTAESILQDKLAAEGHRLFLSAEARVHHVNISQLGALLRFQVDASRTFGALRFGPQAVTRRLLYIMGSVLIPFILYSRIAPYIARTVPMAQRLRVYLCLFLLTCAAGFGEMLGYSLGMGKAHDRLLTYETNRLMFVTDSDRRSIIARYGS